MFRVLDSEVKLTADELVERIVANRVRFLEKFNSRKKKELNFFETHEYKVEEL